jgi:hypothetical protein
VNLSKSLTVSITLFLVVFVATQSAPPIAAGPLVTPIVAPVERVVQETPAKPKARKTTPPTQLSMFIVQQQRVEGLAKQLRVALSKIRHRMDKIKAARTQ